MFFRVIFFFFIFFLILSCVSSRKVWGSKHKKNEEKKKEKKIQFDDNDSILDSLSNFEKNFESFLNNNDIDNILNDFNLENGDNLNLFNELFSNLLGENPTKSNKKFSRLNNKDIKSPLEALQNLKSLKDSSSMFSNFLDFDKYFIDSSYNFKEMLQFFNELFDINSNLKKNNHINNKDLFISIAPSNDGSQKIEQMQLNISSIKSKKNNYLYNLLLFFFNDSKEQVDEIFNLLINYINEINSLLKTDENYSVYYLFFLRFYQNINKKNNFFKQLYYILKSFYYELKNKKNAFSDLSKYNNKKSYLCNIIIIIFFFFIIIGAEEQLKVFIFDGLEGTNDQAGN